MSYLILVRHGQSVWNLEKKFTGWVDVELTKNGQLEAKKAGQLIKKENIETYKKIPLEKIPDTESLKDTYERVIKFYSNEI